MKKRWRALLLCLVTLMGASACRAKAEQAADQGGKVQVAVTMNALKEFAQAVGQDKVQITTVIPDGIEAHDFEPKPQDLAGLGTAAVFVYNGLGMESWVQEAVKAAGNDGLIVVEASKGADVIVLGDTAEQEAHEQEEEERHEEEGHGKYDPHLWLGLKGAQTETTNIKDALVEADPANKAFYEKNCENFVAQLEKLYQQYREKFQSVERKHFVTGHAAFGYLCRDFGLEQSSVQDIYAEGEPSAQQLIQLVEYCRSNEVTTIFAEELVSPAVSQTLAGEVGAKVETIFTMDGTENGKSYLERMEDNLRKIYDSVSD